MNTSRITHTRTRRMIQWTVALLMLSICWLATPDSYAQYAPAGNAHPKSVIMDDTAAVSNPFGPLMATSFDMAKKEKFSKEVDISPLRDLAVRRIAIGRDFTAVILHGTGDDRLRIREDRLGCSPVQWIGQVFHFACVALCQPRGQPRVVGN